MELIFSDNFLSRLTDILKFIAKDSKKRALNFKNELLKQLQGLHFMPYKYRKSLAFDDENIRDFIFKGYVIPYKIEKDFIVILAIYKENLPDFT
ncbi:type II toxin-antitoxin system RelE/ParE family toxin [Campylobacter sp. VTCC 70190]|uniref:type II toxin-antitoxin system RelE/ParE family toxin n=1 Tax=Campylobacter sp. VTCC 70190 TaxID=3392118 RepID=UPI00398E4BD2